MDKVPEPTNPQHKTKIWTAVKTSDGHLEDGDNQLIRTTQIQPKIKPCHRPRDRLTSATDRSGSPNWVFHLRQESRPAYTGNCSLHPCTLPYQMTRGRGSSFMLHITRQLRCSLWSSRFIHNNQSEHNTLSVGTWDYSVS